MGLELLRLSTDKAMRLSLLRYDLMISKPLLLVNTRDACDMIGCKRTKLFALMRDGMLERKKLGSRTMIPYHSLERFAENCGKRTTA